MDAAESMTCTELYDTDGFPVLKDTGLELVAMQDPASVPIQDIASVLDVADDNALASVTPKRGERKKVALQHSSGKKRQGKQGSKTDGAKARRTTPFENAEHDVQFKSINVTGPTAEANPRIQICGMTDAEPSRRVHILTVTQSQSSSFKMIAADIYDQITSRKLTKRQALILREEMLKNAK